MRTLKKKLMFLYITTTGIIVTGVVIGAFFLVMHQVNLKNMQNFETHVNAVVYRLQSNSVLSGLWLSQYEEKNNLLIQIIDNETPFFFRSSWLTGEERAVFLKQAEQKAALTGVLPSSTKTSESIGTIFPFQGKEGTSCYGTAISIPAFFGSIELTMVQILPEFSGFKIKLVLLFFFVNGIGIFLLYLISRKFVEVSIAPVLESQRKQTEFIAAASHELRSPLAVISINVQALMLDDSQKKQFLPVMLRECQHMKRLINDMLLLASSDAKTWTIDPKPLDIETLLIELYESYAPICQEEGKPLELVFPDYPFPFLSADKQRFNQILSILIENAISYSEKGSKIIIRPARLADTFTIDVIDHGKGLSAEEKSHIFDRFYRTDHSRENTEHFGLGLSIAKELVILHKGQLSVSDTVGGGCTFHMTLPTKI